MFYNAYNGTVKTADAEMDYIAFGYGESPLIMLPGLGDGLRTVKGMAIPFAFMYRQYAKDYRVYLMSRRKVMPSVFTTKDMARDVYEAMKVLEIPKAYVVGVSQGGMIAQHLAIDYPQVVQKLVLAVTLSRPNDTIQQVIGNWMEMAKQGDYKRIMIDTAEHSYSENYLKMMRKSYPILGSVGKPKSFDRFLVMAQACLTHDAHEELGRIKCPTLIIGGRQDKIVTGEASEVLAEAISGSRLHMYTDFGHGAYEEGKDFLEMIADFLENDEMPDHCRRFHMDREDNEKLK